MGCERVNTIHGVRLYNLGLVLMGCGIIGFFISVLCKAIENVGHIGHDDSRSMLLLTLLMILAGAWLVKSGLSSAKKQG